MENIKTAVMLVGGEGTRLRPHTNNRPKTLVEVSGRAILEWNTDWLKSHGIENLVFGCGDKKDKMKEFMNRNNNLGFKSVEYSENTKEGGTGEAFRLAIERYVSDNNYIAMNGDELTNLDLSQMEKDHERNDATVTMAAVPFKCPYSIMQIDMKTGKVSGFSYGKSIRDFPISIGIYIFNNRILEHIPQRGAIEKETFPKLARDGEVYSYMLYTGEEWATINDEKQRKEAEGYLERWGLTKKSSSNS